MTPYGAIHACGIERSDVTVVGNWNPAETSFSISLRRIVGSEVADLWFPLLMASSKSDNRLVLLILSRGYFAPLSSMEDNEGHSGLCCRSGARVEDDLNSDP